MIISDSTERTFFSSRRKVGAFGQVMRASYFVQGVCEDATVPKRSRYSIQLLLVCKKLQNLLLSPSGDSIKSIIPGTIVPMTNIGRKKDVYFRITVPLTSNNGWKALAFSDGARQELFITSTPIERQSMHDALVQCGLGTSKATQARLGNHRAKHL